MNLPGPSMIGHGRGNVPPGRSHSGLIVMSEEMYVAEQRLCTSPAHIIDVDVAFVAVSVMAVAVVAVENSLPCTAASNTRS